MIDLDYIKNFYPPHISNETTLYKHLVKEYVELMALDHLSNTGIIDKLAFIGGTNLRLIKGIDRFSEDLDFDCKDMTEGEFLEMTDELICFFRENGLNAEARDKDNSKLTALRRSIHFPQLLFDLGLTAHKEQRFLLKTEAQDQGIAYAKQTANVARCGFIFQMPVPPDSVLLSMKLSALLSRSKGRDFYDTMFLWQIAEPDYVFLKIKAGIADRETLLTALSEKVANVDMELKSKDFEHLLFNPQNAKRILHFRDFIEAKRQG